MRLISYHIESFGKIKNADGDFSQSITQICQKNGYGKTTLASFIKAMFYGFATAKSGAKAFSERERYFPFEGGRYGGNIVFEWQGKIYRVERFFDEKSETKDEFTAYCDRERTNIFDISGVGQTVFGLDKDSFAKTVFVTADDIDVQTTESISERLSALLGKADDESVDFKGVCKKLGELEKEYKRSAKNGVHNDKIGKTKDDIKALKTKIADWKQTEASLGAKYEKRNAWIAEKTALDARIRKEDGKKLELSRWKAHDELVAESSRERAVADGILQNYPAGVPSEAEMQTLKSAIGEWKTKRTERASVSFDGEKEAKLQTLKAKFAQGVPNEETLARVQKNIQTLSAPVAQAEESAEYQALQRKFGGNVPSEDELSKQETAVSEYTTREVQIKNMLVAPATAKTQKKGGRYALILLAIVLLGAGAGLFSVQVALATACIAVGAVLGVAFFLLPKVGKQEVGNGAEIARLQAENDRLKDKITAFLVQYGYYVEHGVEYGFARLKEDARRYVQYQKEIEEDGRARKRASEERENARKETESFLRSFGIADLEDLQGAFGKLQRQIAEYESLLADEESAKRKCESLDGELDRLTEIIVGIFNRYQIDCGEDFESAYERLQEDIRNLRGAQARAREKAERAEAYKQKNGLTERPLGEETDLDGARARSEKLGRDIVALDGEIEDAETIVDALRDLESSLEEKQEALEIYERRLKIISATKNGLETADKNLREKFISPIRERFLKYAQAIERALGEKVVIKEDFTVQFDRGGKLREDKHLSAGEKTVCALCMRLALVDNMYTGEQPFIVMDDPFVHLDAEHFACTARVVKELSKDRQIVYFTCHESRAIL
ncbi:MAG: AAA family ATPase [Clostridia bacterium]|nr:AAA family ATPase [Clostridia bacterium]